MLPHPQNSFHLGTSAVIWSLRTSLQPGLILDKYRRNSWAHFNSLHLSFHKKVILSELFCSFLSWQKDLNEKSHKGSLLGKAAKKIELICFRYSPTTFTQFFLTFTYFQSYDQSSMVHTCNPSTREGRARESLIFETT